MPERAVRVSQKLLISWDFRTQQCLEFGEKNKKTSSEQLLMREVRGEGPDWSKLTVRGQRRKYPHVTAVVCRRASLHKQHVKPSVWKANRLQQQKTFKSKIPNKVLTEFIFIIIIYLFSNTVPVNLHRSAQFK